MGGRVRCGMTHDSTAHACSGCARRGTDVSRRDFVSAAALSVVAVALTACGVSDGSTGLGTGTVTVTLANYPALAAVGGVARVNSSPALAMTKTSSGYAAFSLACTHEGTTVSVLSNGTLQCPNHGAQFSSSGTWTGGFRTSSLRSVPVAVGADGTTATITLG